MRLARRERHSSKKQISRYSRNLERHLEISSRRKTLYGNGRTLSARLSFSVNVSADYKATCFARSDQTNAAVSIASRRFRRSVHPTKGGSGSLAPPTKIK